jgi:hypothetical protein
MASEADQAIEEYNKQARRARKRRMAILALVVASPVLFIAYKAQRRFAAHAEYEAKVDAENTLSEAELDQLRAMIPALTKQIEASHAPFAAATTPELLALIDARLAAGATRGRCPVYLQPPGPRAEEGWGDEGNVDPELVAPGARPRSSPGTSAASTVAWVADHLAKDEARRNDLDMLTRDSVLGPAVFVVGVRTAPLVHGLEPMLEYEPGKITGAAYVYDPVAQRVVCAGPIAVENGEHISIEYRAMKDNPLDAEQKAREAARAALDKDLNVRLKRAIVASVKAVDAPAPPAPPAP